jgi:hypothetical protein
MVTVRGQQVCSIQAAVAAHVPPVAAAAAEQRQAAAGQGAQHSSALKALWDTVLPIGRECRCSCCGRWSGFERGW